MNLKKQQGAALLMELAIVVVLASLGIGAELLSQRARLIDERFAAQGDLIATAKGGVNTYIATNYAALVANMPIPGYANIYAPTIAELRAMSLVPTAFSDTGLFGQPYSIQVARAPAACVPPACDITGVVFLNGAITDPVTGRVEGAGLGTAIAAIGGDGAYSSSIDPTTLAGRDGSFALPNPAGSIAGILGARTGYGSSSFSQFLRRDGSLPMTGDLDMGAQNIGFAKNITATGTVASKDVTATGTIAGKDLTATTSITSAGQIKAGGRLATDEFIQVNGVAVANTACSPNGLEARDSTGLPLYCQTGVWKKQGIPTGEYKHLGYFRGTYNGYNNSSDTIFIQASGGNCDNGRNNGYELAGVVNGMTVIYSTNNNNEFAKLTSISFFVPGKSVFSITSYPYQCPSGAPFSTFAFVFS